MQRKSAPVVLPEAKYGKSSLSQSLNVGRYFRSKQTPSAFKFATLTSWDCFDHVLTRNLERLGEFEQPARFMTTQEIALVVVNPLINRVGLNATFVERRPETFPFIGCADLVLCESTNVVGKPLLVGRNYSDLALEFGIVNYFRGEPSTESEVDYFGGSLKDAELGKAEVSRALQSLCHVMLLNDLAFGYLSSESSTRFVNIVPRALGLELRISPPVDSHQICQALTAMSLEAYYGHPYLRYYNGFEAMPEALEDPNVEPLSSFEQGSVGKIKWWVANRISRQKYTISVDHRAPNDINSRSLGNYTTEDNTGVCRYGVVTIDGTRMLPSLLKICTDEVLVRREACMLQYLLEKGSSRVPKLILYAHLLANDFHVLSQEPFGHRMVPEDLFLPGVEEEMLLALEEIHNCGVMLTKISIDAFAVEYTPEANHMVPIVRIISFTSAKLYRRIPEIAREKERSLLKGAIDKAKSQVPRT